MHKMVSGTNPGHGKAIRKCSPEPIKEPFSNLKQFWILFCNFNYSFKPKKSAFFTMPITSADATEPQISQKDAIVQDLLMDIRLFKTS